MELRQIRQFSRLNGSNNNPGVNEHQAVPRWDNNAGYFEYIKLTSNSKTLEGTVKKGDDSAGANYVWKLDSSKNPDWRPEQFLVSVEKNPSGYDALFTMNDGAVYSLPLGSLAWSSDTIESMAVTSVFGRVGDVIPVAGDYTAAQVTNAFDVTSDSLGDILEGDGSYHFTLPYRNFIDILIGNNIDEITDIGSGMIITDAERLSLHNMTTGLPETIRDTVAEFVNNTDTISWTHDDPNDILTADINFNGFTSDDVIEGVTNLYFTEERVRRATSITLPSAGTVQGRIDLAVPGIDYPADWTLTIGDSSYDLLITHNKGKILDTVNVYSIDGLNQERMLVPFSNAFGGIVAINTNSLLIEALTDIPTKLRINVTFV